jgi:excisionase family DNA binding protein
MSTTNRPMRAAEVAERLGVSVSKVYAMAAAGKLPAHRIGERSWAFDRDEIESYWQGCLHGGQQGGEEPATQPMPRRPRIVRRWV